MTAMTEAALSARRQFVTFWRGTALAAPLDGPYWPACIGTLLAAV